jgi:hypothetical protein
LRGTVKCGTAIPVSAAVSVAVSVADTFAALALITLKSKALESMTPEFIALEFAALEAESLGVAE